MPAATLLVGRGQAALPVRAFGRMSPAEDAPRARPDAIFMLASITKPIVCTPALQLVEEGRLQFSDPVAKFLPAFAANGKGSVRIVHLLTHTSGMPENLPEYARLRRAGAPLSEYVAALEGASLDFAPGTDCAYSNPGLLALAEVVVQIAGRPLPDVLRERVFEPLGMRDTALGATTLPEHRLAWVQTAGGGYDESADWNSPYWRSLAAPWGGLFSAAVDIGRFAASLLAARKGDSPVLRPATARLFTENQLDTSRFPDLADRARRKDRWGLGLKLNGAASTGGPFVDLLGDRVYGHQGVTGTFFWVDPDSELFCVLLTSAGVNGPRAPWARMVAISNIVAAALDQA
jgi:CubicO group peptidase (beta-lactamase class C family)